jgi:hypothetical protein
MSHTVSPCERSRLSYDTPDSAERFFAAFSNRSRHFGFDDPALLGAEDIAFRKLIAPGERRTSIADFSLTSRSRQL